MAGAFALAAESTQTAIANGDTRTLSFYHTHTHERLTVTFKKDGRYDQGALKKLNHYLRDWRNDAVTNMEPRLFDVIWEVQKDAGSKAPVQIISAYRSSETNKMLRSRSSGVAQNSQHTLGRAMDIHLPDVNMAKIREAGLRLQRGGVGFYPTSAKPFVHLDVGNVRHWPRMSRDQLVRLFPDGRTVHIPSDGKPLKNYQLAVADVARDGATVRGMSQSQIAVAKRSRKEESRSSPGGGLIAKLLFGADDEQNNVTPATPADASPTPERATPVAVAAIDQAIPMPAPRPDAAVAGPELASAYAPQQLPDAPGMIWQNGPDAAAGRAATSTQVPSMTPGLAMPQPRPADTTPAALVARADENYIRPSGEPVTASLGTSADLGEARLEAMRLLGLTGQEKPAPTEPANDQSGPSRVATAHDLFTQQPARELPDRTGTIAKRLPSPERAAAPVAAPVAPKSAYSPERSARNPDLNLKHPQMANGLIAKPAGILPASFGGNPNLGMRSDLFGGSPVASLRSLKVGPQRTAQIFRTY